MPPFKTIDIITTPTADHFDMVQDDNNFIYVVFEKGIKVYNGTEWQIIEIPSPRNLRTLFYDLSGRVYFGGWGIIGYIEKDKFGIFQYTILIPNNHEGRIEDIWTIEACNEEIYFRGVHHITRYSPNTQEFTNWNFISKLGAISCLNNVLILQDREKGLLELHSGNWTESKTQLDDNSLIYKFKKSENNSLFILSESEKWQFIKDSKVHTIKFDNQLPSLDNYVSIEFLTGNKFVLGTNNGLLTFIDIDTMHAESFQITNEWISKIVKTKDNGLLVLTEFEVFYLDWPSPIRVQGRQSGLASNILDMSVWNGKLYVSSSAGVFLEEKNQLIYQHKLFERLNWTNKEAWKLLALNDNQALLAESHKIYLVEKTDENAVLQESIVPITDTIYPRKLVRSKYNQDKFYVFTEFDVQILMKTDTNEWQLNKILNHRSTSLIEHNPTSLLIATEESGLFRVKLNNFDNLPAQEENVSELYGLSQEQSRFLKLFKATENIIFAYSLQGMFKLDNNQFVNDSILNLKEIIGNDSLKDLKQMSSGLLYGNTYSKLVYQTEETKWKSIDLKPYIRGPITSIGSEGNEIKVASNGTIITFDTDYNIEKKIAEFDLIFTSITFEKDYERQSLILESKNVFSYIQGTGKLSFSYVLTDIKNQDKIQYRYRLSGTEQSWPAYFNKTYVSFENLPSGEYEFEVQAKDSLGKIYSSKLYKFIVHPHWYLTTTAIIVWALLIMTIVYKLFSRYLKWREKIHEAQKLALKKVIFKKTIELKKLNFSLQKMAHQDGLTGLSNRMYLDCFIEKLLDKDINKVTVIMMDMDYFKNYNDLNGHVMGDELLIELADHLKKEFNKDVVARYGGEEFVAVLINNSLKQAKCKAENIRLLIESKSKKTSISIGISESSKSINLKDSDDIYHLIDQADKALYCAKDRGRNRIEVYDKA